MHCNSPIVIDSAASSYTALNEWYANAIIAYSPLENNYGTSALVGIYMHGA